MYTLICKRCLNSFFASTPSLRRSCPYCGYSFIQKELQRRDAERVALIKGCLLLKGDRTLEAHTCDISPRGVGVKIGGSRALNVDDKVKFVLKELDVDSRATVVWVKSIDRHITRAGLSFS